MFSPCCNAGLGRTLLASVQKCLGCGQEFTDAFLSAWATGNTVLAAIVPPHNPLKQTTPKFKEGDNLQIRVTGKCGNVLVVSAPNKNQMFEYFLVMPDSSASWFEESSLEVPSQTSTAKKETLLDAIIPTYNGERLCNHSKANLKLHQAPKHPYFGVENERTQQSMKALKRWVSTNLRTWPVCRHSGDPCNLSFSSLPEPGLYDGQYLVAEFVCQCNGGR